MSVNVNNVNFDLLERSINNNRNPKGNVKPNKKNTDERQRVEEVKEALQAFVFGKETKVKTLSRSQVDRYFDKALEKLITENRRIVIESFFVENRDKSQTLTPGKVEMSGSLKALLTSMDKINNFKNSTFNLSTYVDKPIINDNLHRLFSITRESSNFSYYFYNSKLYILYIIDHQRIEANEQQQHDRKVYNLNKNIANYSDQYQEALYLHQRAPNVAAMQTARQQMQTARQQITEKETQKRDVQHKFMSKKLHLKEKQLYVQWEYIANDNNYEHIMESISNHKYRYNFEDVNTTIKVENNKSIKINLVKLIEHALSLHPSSLTSKLRETLLRLKTPRRLFRKEEMIQHTRRNTNIQVNEVTFNQNKDDIIDVYLRNVQKLFLQISKSGSVYNETRLLNEIKSTAYSLTSHLLPAQEGVTTKLLQKTPGKR